jgi:amidohydrolase
MSGALSPQTIQWATGLRHALHRRPEISGEEHGTAQAVAAALGGLTGVRLVTGLGGTGIAAIIDSGLPGPRLMIRAELDGLPILETGSVPWKSEVEGRGHLCGHDGHSAILAAMARELSARPPKRGCVILLFQPAEETGAGSAAVLADPAFSTLKPDMALSLHNLPGLALGSAAIRTGPFNFASAGLAIRLTGRTAHASMPEQGTSPAIAMADLMAALPALPASLGLDVPGEALVTLVHARLGEEAFGIAPGEALVMATIRAIDDDRQLSLMEKAKSLAERVAKTHGLGLQLSVHDAFAACTNHERPVEVLTAAISETGLSLTRLDKPFRWSEDFGRFSSVCPAAMFVLGAGVDCPPLHAPDYDFPDALIETGTSVFLAAIRAQCG